ncbi:MAG TPA: cytochrome c biogenesis protein CcdA [Stackebrandtia sp.]|jgi:cytochrome c-type biogenesis protein|uniref:cytochrome c biogenesis CcdA family protein n=1 Tax=Stackebrandtia sp. TaxID=2023065 RepID=UPI002D56C18C|nr:cytochrome c biogenesis protein CcdA [Stackebrandtia sp.]HZE38839.1 cytochrome c biogenesis protein CcdA [Stackebrandtia sp.]
MSSPFADLASNGPLLVAVGVSALAGLVSFLSPCILPLVPGYLSYVTGLSGTDAAAPRRGRVAAGCGLFIAGFTVVFTVLSFAVSSLGNALATNAVWLERVAGVLIVVMGLAFAGLIPGFDRIVRVQKLPRAGLLAAPVLGAVFALSWTPCLSPTLTAVLALSVTQGGTGRGVTLAIAYCLGLGLPFLLFGLGFRKLMDVFTFLKRHSRLVARVGGIALILIGLALVTGLWGDAMNWLRAAVGPGEVGI